jgi:hypothetical protein
MEEKLKRFWQIYDKYIQTNDKSLRNDLSSLLKELEKPSRRDQLFRPEKAWNKILGWQILRNQPFIFTNHPLMLFEGEIIIWLPHWDRDVLITRIPKIEFVSGAFLKPGFYLSHDDQGDRDEHQWEEIVLCNGITDERGLYLPLYNFDDILNLCNNYIAEKKNEMINYLVKEKA